ncbi:PREDICTED: BSD domain-containing protein 1 [Tarenaya hassleriana]|uniref:BSD domain-containing protein 1 n=1 Tax=Tarenaya hassleriana TaxID=28532 RepID=UPI00053C488E|nr:PREDICTED: BSD domain-containing protein 1 [Tarenaya hassleriana]
MNFFKSVFSDDPDPDPSTAESGSESPRTSEEQQNPDTIPSPEKSNPSDGGLWSFGGLMKTLATRSESVLETYRRDLQEFGSGLKKEIEVAQGSLGTVGHAIDEIGSSVIKGTAEIIAHGKEAILAAGNESDSSDNNSSKSYGGRDSFSSKPYSRFDAQVRAVQGDVNTYCDEPEDLDDYKKWESTFSLDQKDGDLERLMEENGDMRGIYKRVVPNMVDQETFWFRYFYKVHKLKQAEDLRVNLVKRAISLEDEEELSWDIDDEDESSEKVAETSKEVAKMKLEENEEGNRGDQEQKAKDDGKNADSVTEVNDVDSKKDEASEEKKEERNKEIPESKTVVVGEASESEAAPSGDLIKHSGGISSASAQPSVQEEDELGWDEIEDLSTIDEKEVTRSGSSPNRAELRKRLSAAEEDEDLSWDIEDDDEPAAAAAKA